MKRWVLLFIFLSTSSFAKHNIGIFISPLSFISGGHGGLELYIGTHWALGAEYSTQNTVIDDSTAYDPYHFFMPVSQGGDTYTSYGPRISYFFKASDQKSFFVLLKSLTSSSEVLYSNGITNYKQDTNIGIFILGFSYPRNHWFARLNLGAAAYPTEVNRTDNQKQKLAVDIPPAFVFADIETGLSF